MKSALIKRLSYWGASVFVLMFFVVHSGFAQKKTPYPIIFIHGINSDNTTWGEKDGKFNDIIDYLVGAGLKFGDSLNICLNYQRSPATFSVAKESDVVLFNTPPVADFYTINFKVRADGRPVGSTSAKFQNSADFSSTAQAIVVDNSAQFIVGDIIRIGSEYMKVTKVINNGVLFVTRGVLGSLADEHPLHEAGLNLSLESNQSSIVKQGYGLKLAIEAIKLKTGAKKVILVGHSMGGLAAREYIQTYSNNDVAKIVTIGTPHKGANITKLPDFALSWEGVDGQSDAVRDLRNSFDLIFTTPGVYLFGGSESSIPDHYYSKDVDGDGKEDHIVVGLDQGRRYSAYLNIARTWIVSRWEPSLLPNSDEVVVVPSQTPDETSNDTLMTDRPHITLDNYLGEPLDYYSLLRGLDEPGDPSLAYEISRDSLSSTTKGFITFGQGNNPIDIDLYKIVIKNHSTLTINVLASAYTRINNISLLNEDQSVRKSIPHVSQSITDDVDPGTYFIQITGTANHGVKPLYQYASYKYPYTLTTTTTVIPPAKFTTSPASTLTYYDAITNQFKDKVVTITNNGSTDIAVSGLSLTGINANQFSITGPTSFIITAGAKKDITVRFAPTSVGAKIAALKITSNSTDSPVKNITLNGSGVDHATKTLTVTDDISYNYGDLTITTVKSKTFTLQNTGSDPLTVSGISITGQNAAEFTISNQPVLPFNLQSGETKQVILTFSPATIGAKAASFVITDNSDNDAPTHAIQLFGNGTNSIYTGITGSIIAYEYWFDDNYLAKVRTIVDAPGLAYLGTNFQTTGLSTGTHFLRIRYQDKKGQWSSVVSQDFYKVPLAPSADRKIVTYEYWFDNNYTAKVTTQIAPIQTEVLNANIDAKQLTTGTHIYNVRFKNDIGNWSAVTSTVFNKAPLAPADDRKIVAYEYWFDNNYPDKITTSVAPVQIDVINTVIDAKPLTTGTHIFNIRFKDDIGEWSTVTSTIFSKAPVAPAGDRKIVAYEYWFDNNYAAKVITPVTSTQTSVVNTNIDAKLLTTGTHIYNIRFKDDIGNWSTVTSTAFSKSPIAASGAGKIVKYEYWFDNNYTAKVSVPVAAMPTAVVNSNINTNALTAGTHNYNIRFQDNLGQWSVVSTSGFIALSKNANLSKLVPGSGTLTPVFAAATTTYTVSVVNAITSITLTPTVSDTTARIKINGIAVASRVASQPINLNVGANVINTVVTAQDGVTTKTYTVTVTRQLSNNAFLTSLTYSPVLTRTTVTGTHFRDYTATVDYNVSSVKVIPVMQDAGATVKVNGKTVLSGSASASIPLIVGVNTINTVVTAADGVTSNTYCIVITRLSAPSSFLTSITYNPAMKQTAGGADPRGANYRDYVAMVKNAVSSLTVTPVTQDAGATVTVNGLPVKSGTPSLPINLEVGSNNIVTIKVTATDKVTTTYYIVTITRENAGALAVQYQTGAATVTDDKIVVHRNVSPNGDGNSDVLIIDGITVYPDNRLLIMSSSGKLIFEAKGYDNTAKIFDGHSSINGKMQLPGTYFYSLSYKAGNEVMHKTGFIVLKY